MNEPTTKAGRWLVDRSDWIDGDRAFRVRINATAGPEDMLIHVLAIEREAADAATPAPLECHRGCDMCRTLNEMDADDATPAPLDVLVAAKAVLPENATGRAVPYDALRRALAATPAPLDVDCGDPFHKTAECPTCGLPDTGYDRGYRDALANPAPLSPIVITVCPHSVDTRFTHCLLCERATPAAYAEETP